MPVFFRIIILFFFFSFSVLSQIYSEKDVEICNTKFQLAVEKNLAEKPIGEVIVEVGKSFLGTGYKAAALEKEGEEQLVINLTGLDCTTYLENVLVFSRLIKNGNTSFEDYKNELTKIRYRDGKIDKYPSRLHYFSDWIFDNISKCIVKDITKKIGGKSIHFSLNFMSENPDKYSRLTDHPEYVPLISEQEKKINKREYFFIPKEYVKDIEQKINNGDLIAVTTSIKGLDIGHVGIAVKKEGRIYLMHAPNVGSVVQITDKPLHEYLSQIKKHSGIIVLRVNETGKT